MKLSFRINKQVSSDPDAIFSSATHFLENNNYKIKIRSKSIIEFNDDFENLSIRSNLSYYKIIDEGILTFYYDEYNVATISLTYKLSVTFEIIEVIAISLFSIYIDKLAMLLLIPAILNFIIKLQYIRHRVIFKEIFGHTL